MAVPAHLRNTNLNIPDIDQASLISIIERTEDGDYQYGVKFEDIYAAWSGLVTVPKEHVGQALRAEFRRTWSEDDQVADVQLNPPQRGFASFGNRILRMSRNGRFVVSLTIGVDGNQYQGEVWIPRNNPTIQAELQERRLVEFQTGPRMGRKINVTVMDPTGITVEYRGQVTVARLHRIDKGRSSEKLIVGVVVKNDGNELHLEGEVDESDNSGRLTVVDGAGWGET